MAAKPAYTTTSLTPELDCKALVWAFLPYIENSLPYAAISGFALLLPESRGYVHRLELLLEQKRATVLAPINCKYLA